MPTAARRPLRLVRWTSTPLLPRPAESSDTSGAASASAARGSPGRAAFCGSVASGSDWGGAGGWPRSAGRGEPLGSPRIAEPRAVLRFVGEQIGLDRDVQVAGVERLDLVSDRRPPQPAEADKPPRGTP